MESRFRILAVVVLSLAVGCHAGGAKAPGDGSAAGSDGGGADLASGPPDLLAPPPGHVAYKLNDDAHVYRSNVTAPLAVEDISAALDGASPGRDSGIALAADNRLLAVVTTRFGCDWDCVVLVPADGAVSPAGATLARAGGQQIHPNDRPALAVGGALIVYSAGGGPHQSDLFVVRRQPGGDYGAPALLTAASKYALNDLPTLTRDEGAVVFDGSMPGLASAIAVQRVALDGTGLVELVNKDSLAGHAAATEVHSGSYAPDGATVFFEGDWTAERIWRRDPSGALGVVGDFENDNTPCVLPDGKVASLWLNRPGNPTGKHELKVMTPDGKSYLMLTPLKDVADIGLSCAN